MRSTAAHLISILVLVVLAVVVAASSPLKDLQVTLRGKKYDISDVTTVEELKEKVKEMSGNAKEHSVLFGGKKLGATVSLRDAGVSDGDQLNMVPATGTSKKQAATPVSSSGTEKEADSSADPATMNAMKEYLEKSGMDAAQIEQMMQSMDGKMPDLEDSLKSMTEMMNSPIFEQYMSNPEMLEQSRQMILNNPMLKGMMGSMPGMEDLLNDPDAFREAMQAAANMYKNMDGADLAKMMGGMGNMPGGPGLFNGDLDSSAATAALDELDEDE